MSENKKKLNTSQRKAVEHDQGPALVVAGAGTGKTTVLIERLKYLFEQKRALPDEVLLLTFTEKGAGEMEERAVKALPYGYVDLWISTFHAFCERLLREHGLDIGLDPGFKLLTQTEQWILIKQNLDRFDLDYYRPLGNPHKFIYELTKHFSRLKDENISAREYLEYVDRVKAYLDHFESNKIVKKNPKPEALNSKQIQNTSIKNSKQKNFDKLDLDNLDLFRISDLEFRALEKEKIRVDHEKIKQIQVEHQRLSELANAYHVYNQLLLESGYLDFGDLITYAIKLFQDRPNILKFYQEKFKYIMVDEFQDTNWSQYELVKMLVGDNGNIMVSGDDDQAIYKFRGASLFNLMQFKDDYPKAREIVLADNYRSGQNILDAAYRLIRHNDPNRLEAKIGLDKRLRAHQAGPGLVEHWHFPAVHDEIAFIADRIKAERAAGASYADIAVLVRANAAADEVMAELERQQIPAVFVSLRGLYLKPLILDLIAYFKLLDNYHESSALFRVLNTREFSVPITEVAAINAFARRRGWSLYQALDKIESVPQISDQARQAARKLTSFVQKHARLAQSARPSQVMLAFAYESGLLADRDFDRDREFYSLLNQFFQKIKAFELDRPEAKLKDFVEMLELEREAGETGALRLDYDDADTVRVMTVHAAKGLEFKYVFLPNLVDKKFPSVGRKDLIDVPPALAREQAPEGKNIHLEEERRLFYVAMTRAKDKLYLLSSLDYGGARDKKPSIFLGESGALSDQLRAGVKGNELTRGLENLHNPMHAPLPYFVAPSHFSFSQLEAFANCPLQYKFNWVLKVPVPAKPQFAFGRSLHSALHAFMEPLRTGLAQLDLFDQAQDQARPAMALARLKELYRENWQEEGYADKKERDEFYQKGWEYLEMFFAYHERSGWPAVAAMEKSFTVKIAGRLFRGAIDRLDRLADGRLQIIDYKTGAPKEKLAYQDKKQLLLYQVALEEAMGERVAGSAYFYLQSGQPAAFAAKPADLDKLKAELLAGAEAICQGHFPPNPGILCAYCDFRGICEFRQG